MSVPRIDELPELVTVEEYASFTRQGLTKAYADVKENRIESIRIGRTIRIPRSALERTRRELRIRLVRACRG